MMKNDEIGNENDKMITDKKDETINGLENDESSGQTNNIQGIRRSGREHKQRIKIPPDEIGDCDDENDKEYK